MWHITIMCYKDFDIMQLLFSRCCNIEIWMYFTFLSKIMLRYAFYRLQFNSYHFNSTSAFWVSSIYPSTILCPGSAVVSRRNTYIIEKFEVSSIYCVAIWVIPISIAVFSLRQIKLKREKVSYGNWWKGGMCLFFCSR